MAIETYLDLGYNQFGVKDMLKSADVQPAINTDNTIESINVTQIPKQAITRDKIKISETTWIYSTDVGSGNTQPVPPLALGSGGIGVYVDVDKSIPHLWPYVGGGSANMTASGYFTRSTSFPLRMIYQIVIKNNDGSSHTYYTAYKWRLLDI